MEASSHHPCSVPATCRVVWTAARWVRPHQGAGMFAQESPTQLGILSLWATRGPSNLLWGAHRKRILPGRGFQSVWSLGEADRQEPLLAVSILESSMSLNPGSSGMEQMAYVLELGLCHQCFPPHVGGQWGPSGVPGEESVEAGGGHELWHRMCRGEQAWRLHPHHFLP